MSSELFGGILARGPVRAALDDRAWIQAMIDAEGLSFDAGDFDVGELARAAAEHGNPVLPLVNKLGIVHKGTTSQDILDTASMALYRAAVDLILSDVEGVSRALSSMASAHKTTPMAGRTLMQRAEPVTFGFVAATWLTALGEARAWLERVRFTPQSGGAVGLGSPYSWHTNRVRVAELAASLGALSGVVAKIAGDVVLLAQTEVGEVSEARPGASSVMPHKRNPVAAISARACAAQAPGLVATLLATMAQEHQRAAGMWHAEWQPLRQLAISTGSAVSWLRECLEGLRVNVTAMLANLGDLDPSAAIAAATVWVDRALEDSR